MSTNFVFTNDFQMVGNDEPFFAPRKDYTDATRYIQDPYPDNKIHYNLRTLSYSGLLTFHSCPRKFELTRLIPQQIDVENDNDEAGHLDFGSVVGVGIQELLVHGNMSRAIFQAFLVWNDNLESERGERSNKTFWHAIQAIRRFTELLIGPLSNYELAVFQGKPAVELGFVVDCGNGFRYRGKLDALLIHRTKREFLPLECKTTGSSIVHEANYQNSSQAIGYALVIDAIAADMKVEYNGYDVFYPVYKTRSFEWAPFRFHKSRTERALWLQSTLLDIAHITEYSELGYFPMHGENCLAYNRPCKFFGSCTLSNEALIGDVSKLVTKLDKVGEYPMEFSMEQLVEAQLEKE